MEAIAKARNLRGSAQKARLVIDLVRGRNVNDALAILEYTEKRAAHLIRACLKSAIANASEKAERDHITIDPDKLWIREAFVDKGITKGRFRMRPAPQGRSSRERRHFCHITIRLTTGAEE